MTKYAKNELLRKALRRDYWDVDEACWLFLGYKHDQGRLYDLFTGEQWKRDRRKADVYQSLWEERADIEKTWSQSDHDYSLSRGLDSFDKYYCLAWASENSLSDNLKQILSIGIKNEWIDQEQLNSGMQGGTVSRRTEHVQVSDQSLQNRLRLIGVLLELLRDGNRRSIFPSDNSLKQYITQYYQGPGLNERTLDSVFAEAKKLVERRLEDE